MMDSMFQSDRQLNVLLRQSACTTPDGGEGTLQTPVAVLELSPAQVSEVLESLNATYPEVITSEEGTEHHSPAFVVTPLPVLDAEDVRVRTATAARFSVTAYWPECRVEYRVETEPVERLGALLPRFLLITEELGQGTRFTCQAEHGDAELAQIFARTGKPLRVGKDFPPALVAAAQEAYCGKAAVRLGELTVFVTPGGEVMLMSEALEPTPASSLRERDGQWWVRGRTVQL